MNFLANPIHGIMSFKEPLCGGEVKESFVRGYIWNQAVQGRCVRNCIRQKVDNFGKEEKHIEDKASSDKNKDVKLLIKNKDYKQAQLYIWILCHFYS